MHTQSFPEIRSLSLILFVVILIGNSCYAANPERDSVEKIPTQPAIKIFTIIRLKSDSHLVHL